MITRPKDNWKQTLRKKRELVNEQETDVVTGIDKLANEKNKIRRTMTKKKMLKVDQRKITKLGIK